MSLDSAILLGLVVWLALQVHLLQRRIDALYDWALSQGDDDCDCGDEAEDEDGPATGRPEWMRKPGKEWRS